MQFTYIVTLRRVRATIVAVGKQQVINIMCVCVRIRDLVIRHANRIFYTHYIVICDLPRSAAFFHIISQTARFSERRLLNIKPVF